MKLREYFNGNGKLANLTGFSGVAKRDNATEKPRPDLVSPFFMERMGNVLRDGAKRYGERNWESGMPMSRTVQSLCRHLMAFLQGDRSEDHLAELGCNVMFLLDVDEKVKRGLLPSKLDDLPKYAPKI